MLLVSDGRAPVGSEWAAQSASMDAQAEPFMQHLRFRQYADESQLAICAEDHAVPSVKTSTSLLFLAHLLKGMCDNKYMFSL